VTSLSGNWADSPSSEQKQRRTGIRILLVVISSLFFLFFVAYMIRAQLSDWEHLSAPWKPLEQSQLLRLNTLWLLLASVCIQYARVQSRKVDRGEQEHQKIYGAASFSLLSAGVFAMLFLAGQLLLWQQLTELGYGVAGNPANSFFFVLTGLHGLHLAAGLALWLRAVLRVAQGAPMSIAATTIDLCAIYWHYLLALWLLLYALLTSSPESYAAFARMCGL